MKTLTSKMNSGAKAFETLGVKTKNADGSFRSAEDVMNDTMNALAGVKDETERAGLASELFGSKVAMELAPTLNSGKDGIQELKDRAKELGLVLSDEGVKDSAAYEDAMTDLDMSVKGLKRSIGEDLMPKITDFVNFLTDKVIPNVKEFLKKIEQFAPVLAPAIGALVAFKVALGISSVIEGLVGALKTLKAANEGARISQLLLNAAMGANPIVLIISLIVAAISALVIL